MATFIKWLWRIFIGGVIAVFLLFFLISVELFGTLPTFEDLENPKTSVATEIISSDGKILGKYYLENRSYTKYEELSPNLTMALIATEDARFQNHSGIDFRALARAITKLGADGGGSTITQQLAKNLYNTRRKSIENENWFARTFGYNTLMAKFKEWVIAVRLEKNYTKKEILAMYLNVVDFGREQFGIKSAARYYFNRNVDEVKVQEAAMLVGLLKAPSYYNPVPEKNRTTEALRRRNTVLGQMVKYEYLAQAASDSIRELPIVLDITKDTHNEGLATYFREYLKSEMAIWASENTKPDGSKWNIYKDGLKIYTTIDSRMQEYAEAAMEKHMASLQKKFFNHWKGWKTEAWNHPEETEVLELAIKRSSWYKSYKKQKLKEDEIMKKLEQKVTTKLFTWNGFVDTTISIIDSIKYSNYLLHCGMMSMEVGTGHVKSWVGGINLRHNQYDHVNQNARRQVGSTFKPFVYATAVDNGVVPCEKIPNQKVVIQFDDKEWAPENSDGKYGGMLDLNVGLAKSVNVIAAYLMKQVGPQAVVNLAKRMGVKAQLDAYPSIALGTCDLSVYEMVGAYGTFPNGGIYVKPVIVTRIEDRKGNQLSMSTNFTNQTTEAFNEQTAYAMCKIMEGVTEIGTGRRVRYPMYGGVKGSDNLAGKTGTTQNNSDGWFMSYSQELVTGCWVGADSRAVHFRSTALGQGASMALPMVGHYLRKVYDNKELGFNEYARFKKPSGSLKIELDCVKYDSLMNIVPVDSTTNPFEDFN